MTTTQKATKQSRVAKYPVALPKGVEVSIANGAIAVKGPLGSLKQSLHPSVAVRQEGEQLVFETVAGAVNALAMSGTTRALVNNMVTGVTKGFERKLSLVGVGYRAQAQGDKLNLSLGFSHPVVHAMPAGIKVETPTQTEIVIKGIDKQLVGQVAAEVRAYREPEPYKGKGVRYADERVVLKETKKK
ncbi:MAG: ribosomal protein [Pseudomonadota bacterium]|jgi:large subunit ribosomal protein L6